MTAVLAEKPGDEKHVFTPPLPEIGSAAPDFSGADLEGEAVTLAGLRGKKATLLFFGSPDCPFSAEATSDLPPLAKKFAPRGAAVAVVDVGGSADDVRDFYMENAPGVTIIADPERKISGGGYTVRGVPFFYVLDAGGKIAARRPFTAAAAATAELSSALGLTPRGGIVPHKSGAG